MNDTSAGAAPEPHDFGAQLNAVSGPQNPWTSVTNIIIALNVVVFVVMGFLGAGWVQTESMIPYVLYGANNGAATTDDEWWRLLTSMFMHYGILHLLLNMWALHQAGQFVEKLLGRWPYALMYLASGLAGGFASIWWNGDKTWSAGASGAVFGVYGAILGYMLREKHGLPKAVFQSLLRSTLGFAGYNIVYGMARAGIDNSAHVGGFVGGIVFGWLLALPLSREARQAHLARRLQFALIVLAVLAALGILFTPRFSYSVREALAWEKASEPFDARERELLDKNEQYFRHLTSTTSTSEYAGWLESTLIPYYEDWSRSLQALELSPEKTAAKTRTTLLGIFDLRIKSYRHLAAGIRDHDPKAPSRYAAEQAEVVAAIAQGKTSVAKH